MIKACKLFESTLWAGDGCVSAAQLRIEALDKCEQDLSELGSQRRWSRREAQQMVVFADLEHLLLAFPHAQFYFYDGHGDLLVC